tara:strand:+ start:120 stop:368 length:249 start_codon:yes stop_codon:yes gene_type:complete
MDYDKMTRKFLLGEVNDSPSIGSYLQSLKEALANLRPATQTDKRRLEIANNHLHEVRRRVRRLQENHDILEERLKILEESKE